MTDEEALLKTIEMWSWLADNPTCSKVDFLNTVHPEDNRPYSYRYLSERALEVDSTGPCPVCLLRDRWSKRNSSDCLAKRSYYLLWDDGLLEGSIKKIQRNAKAIANEAQKKLEEIRNGRVS